MATYLLLKHYRGAPTTGNNASMDQWTLQEVSDHIRFMQEFADRLEVTGEFVDAQAHAEVAHLTHQTARINTG